MYRCQDFLAHFKPGYNSSPKMGQENKKIIEVMYKDTRHMNSITPLGTEKSIPKNSIHI